MRLAHRYLRHLSTTRAPNEMIMACPCDAGFGEARHCFARQCEARFLSLVRRAQAAQCGAWRGTARFSGLRGASFCAATHGNAKQGFLGGATHCLPSCGGALLGGPKQGFHGKVGPRGAWLGAAKCGKVSLRGAATRCTAQPGQVLQGNSRFTASPRRALRCGAKRSSAQQGFSHERI